ncbi:AAA family ATPase [Enterococcus timonensis]|uniref:AAA family ATPase n=1 Tax=Enterococcus timonensis TaxID=1852364 RepID=UPI0008DA3DE5|nr:AAA family ATPase [Enterococcus timonensis]
MKIILIGSSGAGKSTLTRKLAEILNYPVLHLDKIWHTTDYSSEAEIWFAEVVADFMKNNENYIIDGNYAGTLAIRAADCDLIIWLKVPRIVALKRVIWRSLKQKLSKKSRPDMAAEFEEKFDREYLEFLKFVWDFPKKSARKIENILQKIPNSAQKIIIVQTKQQRKRVILQIKKATSQN